MLIRPATEADLPGVGAIYGREAREGHATFDVEARSADAWRTRLGHAEPGDHFLVAVGDGGAVEDGEVVGYATSGPFRPKPAYGHTRETTIYVAPAGQGRGTGRALYDALVDRCRADGVHLLVAAVALPNPASLALHRACGFEVVGTMREVGHKHDRWIDVTWLQRVLD
jgi:phosphinothricin acetyltransferase